MIDFALRRAKKIQPQHFKIDKEARVKLNGHKAMALWFTGLSGSGKSTIANAVEQKLYEMGYRIYVLDGDNLRHGLNKDLGFTASDRVENIRRVAEVARLMADAGIIVLATFISPLRADREAARARFQNGEFFEIFVDTPSEVCEQRDPKGLYKKVRRGEIKNFTGVDSDYERPDQADIRISSQTMSIDQAAAAILRLALE